MDCHKVQIVVIQSPQELWCSSSIEEGEQSVGTGLSSLFSGKDTKGRVFTLYIACWSLIIEYVIHVLFPTCIVFRSVNLSSPQINVFTDAEDISCLLWTCVGFNFDACEMLKNCIFDYEIVCKTYWSLMFVNRKKKMVCLYFLPLCISCVLSECSRFVLSVQCLSFLRGSVCNQKSQIIVHL